MTQETGESIEQKKQKVLLEDKNKNERDKKIEQLQDLVFDCVMKDPKLSAEELAFAFLFHCDSEEFLKAVKKEAKSKF